MCVARPPPPDIRVRWPLQRLITARLPCPARLQRLALPGTAAKIASRNVTKMENYILWIFKRRELQVKKHQASALTINLTLILSVALSLTTTLAFIPKTNHNHNPKSSLILAQTITKPVVKVGFKRWQNSYMRLIFFTKILMTFFCHRHLLMTFY